jgi:poly(glycerol-phosphate) alpha-glucosyltransferase
VLLYLGRIHAKKGLVNLIHAWADVTQSRKSEARNQNDWMLAIAGWDQANHEQELKKLTVDLDIRASVTFLGPLFGADKAAAYQNADAFVLPSLSEGLPMTVLEAWSYRKSVLMTLECNLPEGFATGAALRIGTSANEIAAGLRQLLEMSDHDRIATGAYGHKLVSERFSWPRIGEQMRAVYEWIIGGGSAPGTVRLD